MTAIDMTAAPAPLPGSTTPPAPPPVRFNGTTEAYVWMLVRGSALLAVMCFATVLAIALGFPCAYVLARIRFRRRRAVAMWILSTTMFPPMVAVIPVFLIAGRIGVVDSYPVLIVPYAAFNLPLIIWMLRSAIRQIPDAIDEAALAEAYGEFDAFLRHVLADGYNAVAFPGFVEYVTFDGVDGVYADGDDHAAPQPAEPL